MTYTHLIRNPSARSRPHGLPPTEALTRFMLNDWDPSPAAPHGLGAEDDAHPGAARTARRRRALSAAFPRVRLLIPAGTESLRAADVGYRFRPDSGFVWLTGLTGEDEAGSVLVLEPTGDGHDAIIYLRPGLPRGSRESYLDRQFGELWVGPRRTLAQTEALTGIACSHVDKFADHVNSGSLRTLVSNGPTEGDWELATALAELRLVKDEWEIVQIQTAVDVTVSGFRDVVRQLPDAVESGEGERWVDGVFALRARIDGNGPASGVIAAGGSNACTLHWRTKHGPLLHGDLLLLDAGAEADSLYAADVTRTMPASGAFTESQKLVYDLVVKSQEAGIAEVRRGTRFMRFHETAMQVIVEGLAAWGMLPVSTAEALDSLIYRRWTLTGGSGHMLGLDVHDCGAARLEKYRDGRLEPGMVLTVEPGIYFHPDDQLVPPELRGIGVRIEDDILVTEGAPRVMSEALPRDAAALSSWMAGLMP